MHEAEALEFPWVSSLPRSEKTKVGHALAAAREFIALQKKHGPLVPLALVAASMNVSRQRMHQLVTEGRIRTVFFHNFHYVSEAELQRFGDEERKNGRPFKVKDATFKECLEIAADIARDLEPPKK